SESLPAGGVAASRRVEARRTGARQEGRADDALQRRSKGAEASHQLARILRAVLGGQVRQARRLFGKDGSMTQTTERKAPETKSITVERTMPHSPEKIWRALTQAPMIAEWLMKNDFKPVVGHKFTFHATPMPGWKGYTNCEVKEVVENKRLSYSWGDGTESD